MDSRQFSIVLKLSQPDPIDLIEEGKVIQIKEIDLKIRKLESPKLALEILESNKDSMTEIDYENIKLKIISKVDETIPFRSIRERNELSQDEFAKVLGFSNTSCFSSIEGGD